MPNESLTLEWFYMTFHKSEREQFIMTGRRLVDEKRQCCGWMLGERPVCG